MKHLVFEENGSEWRVLPMEHEEFEKLGPKDLMGFPMYFDASSYDGVSIPKVWPLPDSQCKLIWKSDDA